MTGETKETHLEATKVLRAAYADFINLKGRQLLVTGWLPCFKISRQPVVVLVQNLLQHQMYLHLDLTESDYHK